MIVVEYHLVGRVDLVRRVREELDLSGIVLVGGKSHRLGRNKAVEFIDGQPLIVRIISRLSRLTQQTVVVVNDEKRISLLALPDSAKGAVDVYPDKGPLGGIFTGLSAAQSQWAIVVACDMPFLNLKLLNHMISLRNGNDAIVPVIENQPEPTHALYSKACLPHIESKLKTNDLKIASFFNQVRVKFLPQEEIDPMDPDHLSFFNVNTQQDLDYARTLVSQGQ